MKRLLTALAVVVLAASGVFAQAWAPPPGNGFISGQVIYEVGGKKTVPRAIISIFNSSREDLAPDNSAIQRVPDGLIRVNPSGQFRIVLPPGAYYLGVLFRSDISRNGPPGPEEVYFFPRDDKGELRIFEVKDGQETLAGELKGREPEKKPDLANPLTVEGTLYDEQGKPFADGLILVRSELANPKPLFISDRTGADGKYRLKLPPGGPYYLVARENLVNVGRPRPGEFVGAYGGKPPQVAGKAPTVFSGGEPVGGGPDETLTGKDIVMYKIPNPQEVKETLMEQSESPTFPGRGAQMKVPEGPAPPSR